MATETDIKSPELEAIEQVAKQVDSFKKALGERVEKKEFEEVKGTIEELKKSLGSLSDKDGATVADAIKKINEFQDKALKQIEEMQEDIQKGKETRGGRKPGQLFDPAEVKAFVEATFDKENQNQKTTRQATIKLNSGMVLKTAEIVGYPQFFEGGADTDPSAFTGRFIDPTLYQRQRKQNLILDNFAIESIGVPTLVYLEKVEIAGDDASQEDVGAADWIVSGGQKPMRSFRVKSAKVEAKKVAIFGTVHDELLRDVASLENWIREDLTDEMREAYNDGLLNNNPAIDPNAPLGLKQNAIMYAPTPAFSGAILGANYIDAIIAAAAYMRYLREQPGVAYVSTDVWYAIHILKDNDQRYLNNDKIYVNSLGELVIAGIRIKEADQEDVPSTHLLLVGNPVGFKIKNYGEMVFERGLNGEDFRYDRTSYRAYQRVLSYIPAHRYNTVLYDTWSNIFAGIGVTSGS